MNRSRLLVLFLLVCAAGLRLFAFEQAVWFDSDFGRDSLFAMRILTEKPTLLGAKASVGGFYLGPFYFYGIALLFWMFGFIPQIVNLAFVLLNIFAGYLIYRFLTKNISKAAGIFGLTLFTFNPLLVAAARGATHKPMLPIITVLSVMAIYRSLKSRQLFWHLVSGLTFGLFFHVHFSSLLLLPGYFLAVLLWGGKNWQERLYVSAAHGLGILLMLSPLILFDIRHGFITSRAFFEYLHASVAGEPILVNLPHWTLQEKILNLAEIFTAKWYLQIGLLVFAGIGLKRKWVVGNGELNLRHLLSLIFIALCLSYFFYGGYLYEYYLVIPATLGILLIAAGISSFNSLLLSSLLVVSIAFVSIPQIKPLYKPKYRTITVLARVVHEIEGHIDKTQPDSFTVFKDSADGITGLGYEYRFLLQRDGYISVHENFYNSAEVLYVIREDGMSDPLTLGNWEVAQFGPKTAKEVVKLKLRGKTIHVFALYR